MGQEPDRIRAEIEQTRAEMSETVDALGYKADVKTRAKENLAEKRDSVKESIVGVKDKIVGAGESAGSTVSDKTPDAQEVKYKARRAASVAQQNPLGLALGSVAVGVLAGMLIPSTRVEDEKIGDVADQVKGQIRETASEAVEHGKEVAQEAVQRRATRARGPLRCQPAGCSRSARRTVRASSNRRPPATTRKTHNGARIPPCHWGYRQGRGKYEQGGACG